MALDDYINHDIQIGDSMFSRITITTVTQLMSLPQDAFIKALKNINQNYSGEIQSCYLTLGKDKLDAPLWGSFKENVDIDDGLTYDFVILLCRINEIPKGNR